MKWKIGADGKIATDDKGNPVYVDKDGKEVTLELEKTLTTIGNLFGEAKGNRERAEAAETKLKDFDGIDVTAARSALETVKAFSGKQALTAEELNKARADAAAEANRQAEAKFKPLREENALLKQRSRDTTLNAFFAGNEFIKSKGAVPAEMFQAFFGRHFDVDEKGGIVVKGYDGQSVLSKKTPGSVADANEALEILVDGYQNKGMILKGTGNSGGGAPNNGRTGPNGKPAMSRAEFDGLQPADKAKAATSHVITD